MASKLIDFLMELGKDPDALARYIARPEPEMQRAGLSAEERAVLRSRDPHEIHRALTKGTSGGLYPTAICMFVYMTTEGTPPKPKKPRTPGRP